MGRGNRQKENIKDGVKKVKEKSDSWYSSTWRGSTNKNLYYYYSQGISRPI